MPQDLLDRVSDPEYQVAAAAERRERVLSVAQASAGLLRELREAGLPVELVRDLYALKLNYRSAVPILLKWLPLVDEPYAKDAIVRALRVRWAKPEAAPALIREFQEAPPGTEMGLKWAIADALELVADDSVFEDIVKIATDSRHGRAREMLMLALGKMTNPRAVSVLISLLDDPDVAGHAVQALRKLAPPEARPHLTRFLNDPRAWVRSEAKRAIRKIDARAA